MSEVIEKILFTIDEAAAQLSMSRASLYRLLADDQIPVVRTKGNVRIQASALRKWAEDQAAPWTEGLT